MVGWVPCVERARHSQNQSILPRYVFVRPFHKIAPEGHACRSPKLVATVAAARHMRCLYYILCKSIYIALSTTYLSIFFFSRPNFYGRLLCGDHSSNKSRSLNYYYLVLLLYLLEARSMFIYLIINNNNNNNNELATSYHTSTYFYLLCTSNF